ncbi:MAG: FecR domain-containing protein [Bacteroidetes bacterium]|nr:FecR domain-containing protein [Bacteroidota bacterium]
MRKKNDEINELDDLLRKVSLSNRDIFNKSASLLERTVFDEEHTDLPYYERGEELVKKLESDFPGKKVYRIIPDPALLIRIAALILILTGIGIVISVIMSREEILRDISTTSNTKSRFYLPDSTLVWLNRNSKITFPQSFKERIIYLDGEAYFEVKKLRNKPFTIHAGQSRIDVKGTSFNVLRDMSGENVEVTVVSGTVQMTSGNENAGCSVLIGPGEKGIFLTTDNPIEVMENNDPNFLAWKTEKLIFNWMLLTDVIKTLIRHYDKEIIINDEAVGLCRFNGTYSGKSFDEILSEMKMTLNIEYNYQRDKVIITGEGCE